MIRNGLAFLAYILATSYALAGVYCSEPTAPTFYETKPTKPDVPYCVNEFSGTNTCDEFTISSYNAEVEAYNSALRSYRSSAQLYISELNSYLRDAKDYADCEVSHL